MSAIRDKAQKILDTNLPPLGQEIRSITSDGKDNKKFSDLTNTPHSTMKFNWDGEPKNGVPTKPKGIMTGCNGFTGWFTTQLGQPVGKPLGVFEIETFLKRYKMEKAWVVSGPGKRPKCGDVVRWHTKYHVCVSEGFNGDIWDHCDAGQGGSKTGWDILKRVRETQPFDHTWLKGWLDIDIAFGDGAAEAAAPQKPEWLLDWWLVRFRGSPFYYQFRDDQTCNWTTHAPILRTQKAGSDTPGGKWSVGKDGQIIVNWNSGSVEKFKYTDSGSPYEETMDGVAPTGDAITAVTYF